MASAGKGYLNAGLGHIVDIILAIIPFTSWLLGGITNCKIPATMWPLKIRVIPPNNQLVTGMIAKTKLIIQPKPMFRYPLPKRAIKTSISAFQKAFLI